MFLTYILDLWRLLTDSYEIVLLGVEG